MSHPPVKNPPSDELLRLIFESVTDFAIFTMDPNGALNQPSGRLSIKWHAEKDGYVRLRWRESGVTIPTPPTKRGYGRQLIEEALAYQLGAQTQFEFAEDGVSCELVIPANGRQ